MYMRMKELLLESTDTLILKEKYYSYRSVFNVVTGITYSDRETGKNNAYVGCSSVNGILLVDTGNNEMDNKLRDLMGPFLKLFIDDTYVAKGHSDLEDEMDGYSGYRGTGIKFRVFYVEGKYYFTFWGANIEELQENRGIFDGIIRDSGIETKDVVFEINNRDSLKTRKEFVEYSDAFAVSVTKDEKDAKVESGIEKRIKELNSRLAELEADGHVKGATWTIGEKKKHKLEVKNLELAVAALVGAFNSGEMDLSKVVIKVVDKLEDEMEVIPSEVLYRELENKLKQYGTSAVAIISKLRAMGVNPRDIIREISDRVGGVISVGRLMEELGDYVERSVCTIYMTKKLGGGMLMIWQGDVIGKEESGPAAEIIKDKGEIEKVLAGLTAAEVKMLKDGNPVVVSNLSGGIGKMNESTEMVKYDDIEKLSKSVKTFEGFLASFVGKRLKDLLDGLSFSRLYVMNKYDDMRGDNPQQLVTMLMDTTVMYINFKLILPIRKQLDDVDVLDKQTDEYKEYHRNRMGIVKQILVASRSGDKEKEVELRSQLSLLKDPSSNNMKDMDILVKEIHGRPLTLKDVMPGDSDTEDDKKRYKSAVEAFDNFKNRMLSESDKPVKSYKFKESLRKLVKEVMGEGGKHPKDPYYSIL